jgi:hypothetical protein
MAPRRDSRLPFARDLVHWALTASGQALRLHRSVPSVPPANTASSAVLPPRSALVLAVGESLHLQLGTFTRLIAKSALQASEAGSALGPLPPCMARFKIT